MYRVLIADDEPIERQVIHKKINDFFPEQVEVFLATNGFEAVDEFKKNDCSIALLDIAMPGKSGLEAAEEIRAFDPDCSIIFLTAFDEFSYAKKAIEVKALDYLLKPGSDEDIIGVFEEAFSIEDRIRKQNKEKGPGDGDASTVFDITEDDSDRIKSNIIVREAKNYIDEHYMEDISLQDVAGVLGYSDVYFCKLFKQNFGKSFIVYLNELRIGKAKELLSNPAINIKDISCKAGYRDANYFTRVFKRMTGKTPSDYRNGVLGS
ncbi:response regulator transcription factor [Butyrivibrio sp. X503]|uniref:response regulator transcription factor n=1 Tax=Butyrivibrio sp. X503 TaxID=2364878 RepID=UPI0018F75E6F|nr:response regulator [Butyrivibrio sp. X503]